jgi:hypothetical protein
MKKYHNYPENWEKMRWGVEQRLEFIDYKLYWEGEINRRDLGKTFGISNPQASADISKYIEMAPMNIDYDRSAKCYFATPNFKPILIKPNAEHYLYQLSLDTELIHKKDSIIGILELPERQIESEILRKIVNAIRNRKGLKIEYQSMSRPESTLRWITPHAFGFDGLRWHVRSYCHIDDKFKDFHLGRIISIIDTKNHDIEVSSDKKWHQFITVKIGPHPGLTDGQKKIIERDYGMKDGIARIKVRAAFVHYLICMLRLEKGDLERPPRSQQIVLLNREEVEK